MERGPLVNVDEIDKMRQKYSVPNTGRKRSSDVQPCVLLKKDKVSLICNWKVLMVGKCFSIEMHDIEIFAKICHWHDFLPSKLIKWIMERTKGVSTSILQWWSGSAKRWGPTWTWFVNTSRKYSTLHLSTHYWRGPRRIPLSHYPSCGELFYYLIFLF